MIQEMSMTPEDLANMDSTDRQVEINEWTYNDKMEMLFMSQLCFMGLLVAAIFSILSKYGFFDMRFVYIIMGLIAVSLGLVWFFREAFTRNIRDRKHWNKRNFTGDYNTAPAVPPGEVSAAARGLISLCTSTQEGGGAGGGAGGGTGGGSSNCVP
jgi:hypothetical protein